MKVPLPAELELATRAHDAALVGSLVDVADWELTVRLARYHRVSGRLARTLSRADLFPALPSSVHETLADEFAGRERWFRHEVVPQLAELLEALAARGIEPTVLKGAGLVARGTLAPGERPMADLDLLVGRDEVDPANLVLDQLGYRTAARADVRAHAREHHYQDPVVTHPERPLPVELHWDIRHPRHRRPFPVRSLTTSTTTLDGATMCVLDPPDELAHLCLHFWHDRSQTHVGALGQLHDVLAAASALTSTAWTELVARATTRGHGDVVAATLATARLVTGLEVPSSYSRVEEFAGDRRLQEFVLRRVIAPRPYAVQLLVVSPDVEHRPWRVVTRIAAELRRRTVADRAPGHRRRVAASLWSLARHPFETRSELSLERWAHDVR